MSMHLKRTATILNPDQSRVLPRPFSPGGPERVARIVERIMALPEDRVGPLLNQVCAECRRIRIDDARVLGAQRHYTREITGLRPVRECGIGTPGCALRSLRPDYR
jgi:hypothetical protein